MGERGRPEVRPGEGSGDRLSAGKAPLAAPRNAALVRRLGEADLGVEEGWLWFLNLVASVGVYVSEGVILTRECHRTFLETSGLDESIRESDSAHGDVWRRVRALRAGYGRRPLDSGLNRLICEAIIGLGARTVAVVSGDVTRAGLTTIPEARDAVLKAWLSVNGLKRQVRAASRGEELPTWSVLIQREIHEVSGVHPPV